MANGIAFHISISLSGSLHYREATQADSISQGEPRYYAAPVTCTQHSSLSSDFAISAESWHIWCVAVKIKIACLL